MRQRQHYASAALTALEAEEEEHLAKRTAHLQLHSHSHDNKHTEASEENKDEIRPSALVGKLAVDIPSNDEDSEDDTSSESSYESYYSDEQDTGIGLIDEMLEEADDIDEDGYVHPNAFVEGEEEDVVVEETSKKVLWYTCRRGRVMMWMRFARHCREVANGQLFTSFIFVCIILAGIIVGLQTYPVWKNDSTLYVLDIFVLCAFSTELVIKCLAQGYNPLNYFKKENPDFYWNWFDFIIVVFSLPIFGGGAGSSSLKTLRIVRILRLTKLFKKIPMLNLIITGLVDSLNFVSYIVLLWFLVIFLYAVVGVWLFAENDPWHFSSLEYSATTLFQVTVMDFWGEILYVNFYGCDEYPSVFYTDDPSLGGHVIGELMLCENPEASPMLSMTYFVSYLTITSFCIVPFFIGAVFISMDDCMQIMKVKSKRAYRKQCVAKLDDTIKKVKDASRLDAKTKLSLQLLRLVFQGKDIKTPITLTGRQVDLEGLQRDLKKEQMSDGDLDPDTDADMHLLDKQKVHQNSEFRRLDMISSGSTFSKMMYRWYRHGIKMICGHKSEHHAKERKVSKVDLWIKVMLVEYEKIAQKTGDLMESYEVRLVITVTIVFAGIIVGLQTDKKILENNGDLLHAMNLVVQSLFVLEIALKIVAEGEHPWMYFNSNWNIFDFIVVVGSFIESSNGGLVILIRLFRLFRVIRLAKELKQLQVIITGASRGLSAAFYILILIFVFYYLFAIVGNAFFGEADPATWGKVHVAMIVLTQIATLDNWSSYYYTVLFGCVAQPSPLQFDDDECVAPQAQFALGTFYFVIFTIFGSYVLLALFVGAIYLGMEEEGKAQHEEERVQECILNIQRSHADLDITSIAKYHKAFKLLDITHDNRLGKEELRFGILVTDEDFGEEDFENLWAIMDIDGSNEVDFSEFILFSLELRRMRLAEEESLRVKEKLRRAAGKVTAFTHHPVSLKHTLQSNKADLTMSLQATHSHHYSQLSPPPATGAETSTLGKKKRRKSLSNSSIRSDDSVSKSFSQSVSTEAADDGAILTLDIGKSVEHFLLGKGASLSPPPIMEEASPNEDTEQSPPETDMRGVCAMSLDTEAAADTAVDTTDVNSYPVSSSRSSEAGKHMHADAAVSFDKKPYPSGKFTPTRVHPARMPVESVVETNEDAPPTPRPPSGMKSNASLRPSAFVHIPFIAGQHDDGDNDSDCGEYGDVLNQIDNVIYGGPIKKGKTSSDLSDSASSQSGSSDAESDEEEGSSSAESDEEEGSSDAESDEEEGSSDAESDEEEGSSDAESDGEEASSSAESDEEEGSSDAESDEEEGSSDAESDEEEGSSDAGV